jgi:hypothetical protein
MKHVGKMKNNGAKIAIVYRTLPGDPHSALVVGTNVLGPTYHDALMSTIQDDRAQQAYELADVLAVRKFPDGSNMLEWLHTYGHLKKVPTTGVIVTPTAKDEIILDELNRIIAQQKNVSLEDLAISNGEKKEPAKKSDPAKTTSQSVNEDIIVEQPVEEAPTTPTALRSKADKLFKEAQALRKQADAIDPPKSKKKAEVVEAK